MEISESSHLSQSQRKEQKCIFAWTQKSIHMISELKENLRALIHPKVQGNKKDTSLNQNDAHDIYIYIPSQIHWHYDHYIGQTDLQDTSEIIPLLYNSLTTTYVNHQWPITVIQDSQAS